MVDKIQPGFEVQHDSEHGRVGKLTVVRDGKLLPAMSTPMLYPVVCLMTGVSPRGGGIWKYVLRNLMENNIPSLSQVLHFLDFNLEPRHLLYWREKPLRERYREVELDYKAPLFLDSGGFKLLFNINLDLSSYNIRNDENQAKDIVDLQLDLGGDLVASLDYPLPNNLDRAEAQERMQKSLENAIQAALYLARNPFSPRKRVSTPYFYVCCHGQNRNDMRQYVENVFQLMKQNGLAEYPFGLAIGSIVPLRGTKKYEQIVELILGAKDGIPEEYRAKTPIHVFGVSGNIIPLLTYLGVDSFDSSSYIQTARGLNYFNPNTNRLQPIFEMNSIECDCRICRNVDLFEMQQALAENGSYRVLSSGRYKSEFYADIALHNLEIDYKALNTMTEAINADEAMEALVQYAESNPEISGALEWLATKDDVLKTRIRRTVFVRERRTAYDPTHNSQLTFLADKPEVLATSATVMATSATVRLSYTSDSFRIPEDYRPPQGKRILLIIPCSADKPYSQSKTHRILMDRLLKAFGSKVNLIHKVTLSGLYGPVPEEFETEEPVLKYEFRLAPQDYKQTLLCTQRIREYVEKYSQHYDLKVGYATSLAYRTVLQEVSKTHSDFILLPTNPKKRKLTEFFRIPNINELIETISNVMRET
ncbi:tRNA-guanine transglycosylase [Candidatus Poribacteria bacterium]|nr:tRNA-guanine transglycosylase [Candidatus Poribacteria bacterium]